MTTTTPTRCREFLSFARGHCNAITAPGAPFCAAHLEERRAHDRRMARGHTAASALAAPTPSPGATTSSATRPATARAALAPTPHTHPDPIGRQTAAQPPRKEPPTP